MTIWPKSAPLAAQMMLTLVGSIVATAVALTTVAYQSVADDLDRQARARVRDAALSRGDVIGRMVEAQQDRAERFLSTTAQTCGELRPDGATAWETQCAGAALAEFRITERAAAAVLFGDDRPVAGAGRTNSEVRMAPIGLASLVTDVHGRGTYVIRVEQANSWLALEFSVTDLRPYFDHRIGISGGEVFLRAASGPFLTPARYSQTQTPTGARLAEASHPCGVATQWRDLDYRGVDTFHGVEPLHVFAEGACVEAHLGVAEALHPATLLMNALLLRGGLLASFGVILSLIAASWLARPVLRLAADAAALRDGDFERPIRVEGPSEVAELGRSLGAMSRALVDMISRERRAREDAEEASRAKDEFLAVLSHELRTPLTVTLGWARLLKAGHLDSQRARGAVDAIERATVTQTHLVNDLLDVSRIIAGRLQIERHALALAGPVQLAIDQVRSVADRRGIAIDVDLHDAVWVEGDALRLQQIASNLVTNAVKFSAPGGRVTIELTHGEGCAQLAVRDSGVGIPPEILPFIFDRFRQADGGPTRRYGGLGLGLAIVRHLATLHGGAVQALSGGPGKGSVFIVRLPLASSRPAPAAVAAPDLAPSRLQGVRLLLVDDDDDTRQVVRALLEEVGASVTTAGSAAEARHVLAQTRPAVIVSDLAMPGEDGYAFIRAIRESGIHVPAIALTAHARREDAAHALAAGFQLHMPKPVDRAALIAAVSSLTAVSSDIDRETPTLA